MYPCSLSEAMRLGFQINPNQGHRQIIDDGGRICGLGAVLLGIGKLEEYVAQRNARPYKSAATFLVEAFPEILHVWGIKCPVCDERGSLISAVGHLNDKHLWSPEQLIAFVESVEAELGYVTISESVEQPVLETDQFAAAGLPGLSVGAN